jgi:prepilin-type N-terminal cleavage/methylation domain-containing protein
MQKNSNLLGYTLIELSVVLVIISLLTAGGLTLGAGMVNQAAHIDTKKILNQIDQSLRDYYTVNGRLPCPAVRDLAITHADFGREVNSGACNIDSEIAGTRYSNDVHIGMIPVRALGLSDRAASDKYGNRILYAVTRQLTDASVFGAEEGAIQVLPAIGGAILDDAAYFVWSAGKDHKGAPLYTTAAIPNACAGAALDEENCNNDHIFREAPFNNGEVEANFFDDHARWAPKFHLSAMSSSSDTLWAANGDTNLYSVGTDGQTSNTNVGIGTDTPDAKLDVTGRTRAHQLHTGGWATLSALSDLYDLTSGDDFILGTVGIAGVANNEIVFMNADANQTIPDDGISFVNYGISGAQTALRIAGNGNVGIGKADPQATLDVEGEVRSRFAHAYNPGNNSFMKTTSGQYGGVHLYDSDNDVSAGIMLHNSATNGLRIRVGSGDSPYQATRIRVISSSGYVSIGGHVAQEKLHVDGRVRASDFTTTSDERLKKNIERIDGALDGVRKLNGVYFQWDPDSPLRDKQQESFDDETRHLGVIAQNVQAVYPEAVHMGHKTVLTVDSTALVPVLIEAVKELDAQNAALTQRLEAVENASGGQAVAVQQPDWRMLLLGVALMGVLALLLRRK